MINLNEIKTTNEVLNHNNPAWKEVINWLIEQAEKVEQLKKENELYENAVSDDDITKTRYATTIGELVSLNLWSARRLHMIHKDFAYDELEKIMGFKYERI